MKANPVPSQPFHSVPSVGNSPVPSPSHSLENNHPLTSTQSKSNKRKLLDDLLLSPVVSEIKIPSDAETSFVKDVRYSLEVWIPADNCKLVTNLNVTDRNFSLLRQEYPPILTSGEMLSHPGG